MKQILFTVMTVLLLLGCSKENEEKSNELEFIQVKVTSEDTPTPDGNIYLFKVSGYKIDSDRPNSWAIDNTPFLSYNYNGESKTMLPISEYGSKHKGDLLLNEKEGYSVESFYWNNLSSTYGTPTAGDEYLVFIELRNGTYARASKRFKINNNSQITVKLPTCTDKSRFVDGEWSIADYQ